MAPFILSQVPETTLLLRNPGRENISLMSFENSTNRSHEDLEHIPKDETTRVSEFSGLGRATLASVKMFLRHIM